MAWVTKHRTGDRWVSAAGVVRTQAEAQRYESHEAARVDLVRRMERAEQGFTGSNPDHYEITEVES